MKQSDDTGLFVKLIAESVPEANCVAVPQEQANAGSGEASIATGFPPETFIPRAAGGVPPRGQDMNGFLNRLSHSIRVLQSGYTPKFDAVFANAIGGYPAGAVVSGLNVGNFWVSVTDNNLSTPGANGATWQSLFSDYATNTALSSEADARYKADQVLQAGKISRIGDSNITGVLSAQVNSDTAYAAYGGIADSGGTQYAPGFWVGIGPGSRGGLRYIYKPGEMAYTSIVFFDGGIYKELQLRSDGRFANQDAQVAAWVSELPTSGTIPGGTYTKTGNILQQHFTVGGVVHVDNGFWVSFPVAYSQTPQAINLTANTAGDMDAAWFGASPTGFFIMVPSNSATSNQPVSVLVSGVA